MEHKSSNLEIAPASAPPAIPKQDPLLPLPASSQPDLDLARPEKSFPSHLVRKETEKPKGMEYPGQEAAKISNPLYVTPLKSLGEEPAWIDCPFCRERTMTRVAKVDSTMTTMAGFVCCLFTCIGACIPCICGWCQDVDHFCTKCKNKVTHQPHDGPVQVMETATANAAGVRPQQQVPSVYAMANQQPQQVPSQFVASDSQGKQQGV